MFQTRHRPDEPAERPVQSDPHADVLLELHRELWAAQHRQAAAVPGTQERRDADGAVGWFEWLLVDYLQRAVTGPAPSPTRRADRAA
jgi:hypothetical protein